MQYSNFPLAICFTYGNVYISVLLSQFIPPSPSPAVAISVILITKSRRFASGKQTKREMTGCEGERVLPPGYASWYVSCFEKQAQLT